MDLEQLQQGSYKGVPFLLASGTTTGGNKNVVHAYPNSDRQTVENLGNTPRSYALDLIIPSTSYIERRDALLAAVAEKTPGPLIHPMYGRIENVIAGPFSLTEDLTALGDGKLSVTFLVDNGPQVPEQAGLTEAQVLRARDLAAAAVQTNLSDNFQVTPSYAGSFESASASVSNAAKAFKTSQSPLDMADDLLNAADALASDAAALILAPANLATRLTGMFDQAAALLDDPLSALNYYQDKFNFGIGNGGATARTAAQLEAASNKALFDSAMRVQALCYAYAAAIAVDYGTLDDVEEMEALLELQYAAVVDLAGTDTDTREALADLRQSAQEFLDTAKLTARRVITVTTHPTTARLLAFRYYGDDNQGESIVNLNNGNVSNLSGSVQVLTE